MEYLKDYEFTLHYHPGKENVVVDALNRKSQGVFASVASQEWQILEALGQFELHYRGLGLRYFWEFNGYAFLTKKSDQVLGTGHRDIIRQGSRMIG